MAAKKPTTKKPTVKKPAAAKKVKKPPAKKPSEEPYNFLDDDNFAGQAQESMLNAATKRKRVTTATRLQDVRKEFVVLPWLYWQQKTKMIGLPHRSVIEIMGEDTIGKSTLLYTIGGHAMMQGSPFFVAETEEKLPSADRIKQALHTNPAMAEKLFKKIVISKTDDIASSKQEIEEFVRACRYDLGVPRTVPIVVGLDTFSKLLSPNKAKGRSAYDTKSEKVGVEFGESKVDFSRAKAAHEWCCEIPAWLRKENVIFIILSHQNQKVQTQQQGKGGGGSFIDPQALAGYNRTKPGGNAFNQTVALQLVLTYKGMLKRSGNQKVGSTTKVTIVKNSFGPRYAGMDFDVISDPWRDTDTLRQPAICFARPTMDWLAEDNQMGIKEVKKRYGSDQMGFAGLDAWDAYEEIETDEVREDLGVRNKIIGYDIPDTSEEQICQMTVGESSGVES